MTQPYRGWTSPAYGLAKRDSEVARGLAARPQVFDQSGRVLVIINPKTLGTPAVAEGSTLVSFGFRFTEKPIFTFGSELADNQFVTAGSFPSLSATAAQWVTEKAGYATLWLGCTLHFVVSGTPGLKMYLHYAFRGTAMSGTPVPYNSTGNA